MSARIRGSEATVRFAVDGQLQEGSFFKVKDFTLTPRTDIKEEDYIGELETDLDVQHHGFDFSFSIDNQDEKPLELMALIVDREQNQLAHPNITGTVIYAYREAGANNKAQVMHECFVKIDEQGFSGRKDYVSTKITGKCKRVSLLSA